MSEMTAAAISARGEATSTRRLDVPIERIEVSAYTLPTDFPESDGTLEWNSTTLVLVEAAAGGERGLGLGLDFKHADAARFAVSF